MKKIIKNSIIASVVVAASTSIIVPSVYAAVQARNSSNYDFGLAVNAMTTLNYLKYNSVGNSIQSLVEGIIKTGPTKNIVEALSLPEVSLGTIPLPMNTTINDLSVNQRQNMVESSRYYPISDYGFTTAVLAPKLSSNSTLIAVMNPISNRIVGVKAILNNGQSTWNNGDPVIAQDFIDSLQYVLDFNTGSQLINNLINLKIKNTEKIIAAQEDYIKQFKVAYKNPFGRANYIIDPKTQNYIENPDFVPWESQNLGDEKYVKAIKDAVSGFGVYTGQAFVGYTNDFVSEKAKQTPSYVLGESEVISVENPEYNPSKESFEQIGVPRYINVSLKRNPFFDWKKQSFDPTKSELGTYEMFAQNRYQLFIEFEESTPETISNLVSNLSGQSALLPINRKFVETVAGGIHNFGSTLEKFLWNGPFNVEDISLGTNGYLILKKRKEYYSEEKTLAERIKIFFQKDPIVTKAMFEQGYIAESDLPTISQLRSWTDPKLKPLMEKKVGYGTIALQLNLDPKLAKKRQTFLDDPDLRVAIAFAINREEVLKIAGWDASFPVVNWTAFGQSVSTRGFPLESYFDNQFFTTKYKLSTNNEQAQFPLQNYTHHDHQAKSFTFEHVKRTDTGFSLEAARAYMNAFRAKHPDLKKVTLQYISNSSPEQINAGLAIKDQVRKAFGDFLEIDLKDLPANVYDELKTKGQFDISYGNFDVFGTSPDGYVKIYFFSDGINTEQGKNTGYRINTAGDWTYDNYFKETVGNQDELYYSRLKIEPILWNKIKELAAKKENETEVDHKNRVNSFFTTTFNEEELKQGWDENGVFQLIAALEKIIRDAAPIIPLMEVDTKWIITRLGGIRGTSPLSLQYAYDISKPPRPTLPKKREGS